MIHLDRGEAQTLQAGDGADLAHEPIEPIAGVAIAEAAQVDAREHDFWMTLRDPALDLGEHRRRSPAPSGAAHLRDHAEAAAEAAAVLDLDERPNALEAMLGLNAPDRTDRAGDRRRSILTRPAHDAHVARGGGECAREVRAAAGHVDLPVAARGPGD